MQMQTVWYVLIHISLGLIGWKIFTFTTGRACSFCCLRRGSGLADVRDVQDNMEKFDNMRAKKLETEYHKRETRAYWMRMGRLYFFRSCAYALITLFVAWLMRGVGPQ